MGSNLDPITGSKGEADARSPRLCLNNTISRTELQTAPGCCDSALKTGGPAPTRRAAPAPKWGFPPAEQNMLGPAEWALPNQKRTIRIKPGTRGGILHGRQRFGQSPCGFRSVKTAHPGGTTMRIAFVFVISFLAALVALSAGPTLATPADRPSSSPSLVPPGGSDLPGGAVCFYCARNVNPVVEKWKSRKRSLETERLQRTDGLPESSFEFMMRTFF